MIWNKLNYKILIKTVWFTDDLSNMSELNVADKFNKTTTTTKKLFRMWSKRVNTPLGKMVYLLIMMPNASDTFTQKATDNVL